MPFPVTHSACSAGGDLVLEQVYSFNHGWKCNILISSVPMQPK